MLTDFGLAHPSINPTRHKQINVLPNKSDTSCKQKSTSCDLNVRYLLTFYPSWNFKIHFLKLF
jgi:hypothetical protein